MIPHYKERTVEMLPCVHLEQEARKYTLNEGEILPPALLEQVAGITKCTF